jgi:hypothetical protein
MNGWDEQFEVLCFDEFTRFSDHPIIFEAQKPAVQKAMTVWYSKQH